MNFDTCTNDSKNNLNLIRLMASVAVTLSHSYILTKNLAKEPLFLLTGTQTFGYLAVFVFFVVSGFLISRSFDKNSNITQYLLARALRIYPALLAALVFCVIPIGLTFSSLSPSEYIKNPQIWHYITDNLLFKSSFQLPGLFTTNPESSSVNGSLWSLRYEVYAYILVVLFGWIGLLNHRATFNAVILLMALLYTKAPVGFLLVPGYWDAPFFMPILGFSFGMFAYVNRSWVPCKMSHIAVAFIIYYFYKNSEWVFLIYTTTIGYLTLALSFHPKLQLGLVKKNDYSYGIYVYSFPIQQTLLLIFPKIDPLPHFFTSLLIVVPLSMLSWHFLEQPSLRLKKYFLQKNI